jgi:hypothetical protein
MTKQLLTLTMMVLVLTGFYAFSAERVDAQETFEYHLLSTSKTSTMEEELNEASEAGFRLETVMGGDTAFGGDEVVVIMSRGSSKDDAGRYQYKLLATQRTSTMERELQEAGNEGYVYVGQTVFSSFFGGDEVTIILERDRDDPDPQPYEYRLLATSRTSTMQEELQESAASEFTLLGMTVGVTSFGRSEVVAIMRRSETE